MATGTAADVAVERIKPVWLMLRLAWVAIELILVLYFGQQGALFFYQNF